MKEALETIDGMSSSELDAELEHSYNQSIAGEGKPMDEVFDAISKRLLAKNSEAYDILSK